MGKIKFLFNGLILLLLHKASCSDFAPAAPLHFSPANPFLLFKSNAGQGQCIKPPAPCDSTSYDIRTYDGSCNNLKYYDYGIAKSRYGRLLAPNYYDKYSHPAKSISGAELPNARTLSISMFGEEIIWDDLRSIALMQWGQLISHDISKSLKSPFKGSCCKRGNGGSCYSVPVLLNEPYKLFANKSCLEFKRALSDTDFNCKALNTYSEKISGVSVHLDLNQLYGNSKEENARLRKLKGGLLKSTYIYGYEYPLVVHNVNNVCLPDNPKCFQIADGRNNFTPPITVLHILLLREHNRLARLLKRINPHSSDEKLFQLARQINIAQFQKISLQDYTLLTLGPEKAFSFGLIHKVKPEEYVYDYNPHQKPVALVEFSAAAFRYCHAQIPDTFTLISQNMNNITHKPWGEYFGRAENIDFIVREDNFDSILRGIMFTRQKRVDINIASQIKHHLGQKRNDLWGNDLLTTDIQRGRDFGVASYNEARVSCGLPFANNWEDLENEIPRDIINRLKHFYLTPSDLDLRVAGSLEHHLPGSLFGPTFGCIIGKQFQILRTSDRFFYEHRNARHGFTPKQLAEIRKVTLSTLICNNGNNINLVPINSFIYPNKNRGNPIVSCEEIPKLNINHWKL